MNLDTLQQMAISLASGAAGTYLTNKAVNAAAAHPNFELEQKKVMQRLNKIVEHMDKTRQEINFISPDGLSKPQAVEFWSTRESQLLELVHDFEALKVMAQKGEEMCKKVLEEAELRERQWWITTALHDLGICIVM